MDLTSPLPFRHQREPHMPKPLEIPATALRPKQEDLERAMETQLRSNSLPTSTPSPRSPLPPHKLAKLANALGVSMPMPAFYNTPSPSGTSSLRAPSRYLLHVVPPIFLASDDDDDAPEPDGASAVSATSYRTQFRRGTLIPLYPSLQSQLGAIAREYNLPSTGGLVLYLVQSSQGGTLDGPRISDDVWKLLWYKALQAERQDSQSRATSFGFRSGRSTPSSPFNNHNRDPSQPLSSTSRVPSSPFPYPSPSTSSTPSSEIYLPLSDQKQKQASTPDLTSITSDLTPNPFLPILAKVEFDIDRRKALWFDSWAHDKRERSRWRSTSDGGKIQLELAERSQSRSRRRFHTGVSTPSEASSEYAVLDDGEGENTAVDEDEQDQATIVMRHRDPLADVFGNDAATWSDMHAGRQDKVATGLGITAPYPELIVPPGSEGLDEEGVKVRDEEEVVRLWDKNQRPTLSLNPPDPRASPRKGAPPPLNLISAPEDGAPMPSPTVPTGKPMGSILPYLNGQNPHGSEFGSSASEKHGDKRTRRRTGMVFGDLEVKIVREPEEMTEEELAAHRSSQVIMKHKLDQLEKQLAQLSPRHLDMPPPIPPVVPGYDPDADRPLRSAPPGIDKFNLSLPKHSLNGSARRFDASKTSTPLPRHVDDPFNQFPPRNDSLSTASHIRPPRLPEHKRAQSSQSSSGSSSKSLPEPPAPGTAWPSVAHTSLAKSSNGPSSPPPASRPNSRPQDRSPPQLTIKRASGAQRKPTPDVSEESRARSHTEGQDVLLPGPTLVGNPDSPVIPLSPDPFGKRPVEEQRSAGDSVRSVSTESRPPSRMQGTVLPGSVPEDPEMENQSSRFSADSEQGIERLSKQRRSRTNSIMSVRSLRNLWRKSNAPGKGSGSGIPTPPLPAELSPSLPSPRPSLQHSRGDSSSQRSVQLSTERTRRPSAALRPDSGSDPFQFDNANIYKSSSSSSLASAILPQNYASASGSIGQSKGILKGWTGNANPSDAEARRMRRPSSLKRSTSTASASLSEAGERSADSRQSSPPSSPPDATRTSMRYKQASSPSIEPVLLSHSLPTASAPGLSRYPEGLPSSSLSSGFSFDNGSTPRLSEFEIISPPTRSTPSSSYNGEVL